jgi:tetratricopeptide (TPR) repeat protein
MRVHAIFLVLLLPTAVRANPVEDAAASVLKAQRDRDESALRRLAARDEPDPWLVADELCARGEHDAARALATAAPRKELARLPDYVDSRREVQPDRAARRALEAIQEAQRARNPRGVLEVEVPATGALDSAVRIRIACERGLALGRLRRFAESARILADAARAAQRLGWLTRASRVLRVSGMAAYRAAEWSGARDAWQARLALARDLGKRRDVATTRNDLGLLERRLGNYPDSLRHFAASLKLKRELRDGRGVAVTLHNIAGVRLLLGDHREALRGYHESLELKRAMKDDAGIASTLNDIGVVHKQQGDYPEALRSYEASLKIKRVRGDKRGVAVTLNNIAIVHLRLGGFSDALRRLEEALEIQREIGDRAGIARALNSIGIAQKHTGNHDEAIRRFEESLEIYRSLRNGPEIASVLGNIGGVHERRGELREALRFHEESRKLYETLGDDLGLARTYHNIGATLGRQRDPAGALEALEKASELLGDTAGPTLRARVIWSTAGAHLDRGRPERSAALAREGVRIVARLVEGLEQSEGAGARDVYAGLFGVGIRAALETGDTSALAWFFEQGRAGSLREAFEAREALQSAVLPPDLRDRLAVARDKVNHARATLRRSERSGVRVAVREARGELERARLLLEAAIAAIQREARAGASLVVPMPDDLGTIRAALGPGEALVYYGLTGATACALVVEPGGARAVKLAEPSLIVREASMLSGLGDRPGSRGPHLTEGSRGADPMDAVPALRRLLVEPLGLDDGVRRVLVSPMGEIGSIPFAMLLPRREVAYVPSGTMYGLLRKADAGRGRRVLALGDPDYGGDVHAAALAVRRGGGRRMLASLPATREEVEAVGDVKLLSAGATESGLRKAIGTQERWRAVHLACHGLVDPVRPMRTCLAMTADGTSDGFLTALEVFRMRIPADLVVLSACETGRGRVYRTEGIVGLTWAFMFAGAPRVVCSLWKVDDAATRELMSKFYELWNPKDGSKGIGAAAALAGAQAHVRGRERWKHPSYWAAWVLWGLPD